MPSIGRSVLANQAAYAVNVVTALVMAPFIVHSLGAERYGAWALTAELAGYYGLLDLGIQRAVGYYVARHAARAEHDELDGMASAAFWTLAAIGAAVALGGSVLAYSFPGWFLADAADAAEITRAMQIIAVTVALTLPMQTLRSVLVGRERFDLVAISEILVRVLSALGIYVALTQGGGLVEMATAQLAAKAVGWAFETWQARRAVARLALRPAALTRERLHGLARFGGPSIVIQIGRLFSDRTPMYILSFFLGAAPVAYFNVGRMLVEYAFQMVNNGARALAPRMTELHSAEGKADLRRLFLSASRLTAMFTGFTAASLFAFGPAFLALWMGPEFVEGDWSSRSDIVLIGLLAAHLPRLALSASWQLMFSLAEVRFPMWVTLGETASNLALCVALVDPYGVPGILAASLLPLWVAFIGFLGPFSLKLADVSAGEYGKMVLARPLLASVLIFALDLAVTATFDLASWPAFAVAAGAAGAASVAAAVGVGLRPEDRRALQAKLLRS